MKLCVYHLNICAVALGNLVPDRVLERVFRVVQLMLSLVFVTCWMLCMLYFAFLNSKSQEQNFLIPLS